MTTDKRMQKAMKERLRAIFVAGILLCCERRQRRMTGCGIKPCILAYL